jgi:hypothetical protein
VCSGGSQNSLSFTGICTRDFSFSAENGRDVAKSESIRIAIPTIILETIYIFSHKRNISTRERQPETKFLLSSAFGAV